MSIEQRRAGREDWRDEQLVVAVRAGDADAMAELWLRHAAAGRRAAVAITTIADPDDLTSEAFAAILAAIRKGKGPTGAFRPYLYATIRNLARTSARHRGDLSLDAFADQPSHDDAIDRVSTRSVIREVLSELPERHRAILWYLEVEGMKPGEVAKLVGLTSNAVSAVAFRARRNLRRSWSALSTETHRGAAALAEAC